MTWPPAPKKAYLVGSSGSGTIAITGSVVVDIYFSTGGIGKAFVDSALNRDYAVMMGVTILVGALTILFNLVVDILYAWIDPKIRY